MTNYRLLYRYNKYNMKKCKLCKHEIFQHHENICSKLTTEYILSQVEVIIDQNYNLYLKIIKKLSKQFVNFYNVKNMYVNYEIFEYVYIDHTIAKLLLFMIKIFNKSNKNKIYCLQNILDILYICAEHDRMITYDWYNCHICSEKFDCCRNALYVQSNEVCDMIRKNYISDMTFHERFSISQNHLSLFVIYCLLHNIVNHRNLESYLSLYFYINECNNDIEKLCPYDKDTTEDILRY